MLINQVCAAIEAVRHLFPFQEFALLFKTQSRARTNKKKKTRICLEESIATSFHRTSCLHTIRGQMLRLSAESRSEGAPSPLCFPHLH